jgi:Arf-GAP/coiled-coil/ANK repeat/PH domain-containing protein
MNKFVENEVKSGLDLHAKMVRAREAYDAKLARAKKKDDAEEKKIEEKKKEFELANVKYVQKLIDVQTKKDFELMDTFTTWMVCSLTHHKRAWKLLDELQPMIKQHKKKMLQDSKQYSAEAETRTTIVKESLAQIASVNDIEGYLSNLSVIGKPRRFWAVSKGVLSQYRNYVDKSPILSYDLLLFTVKPVPEDAAAFCLVSPKDNIILQAGSVEEKTQWMTAIAASISDQLNAQSADKGDAGGGPRTSDADHPLQRIRQGNKSFLKCADCGAADPEWGAINLGIIFCIHCSGIHRNLGVHISQVRSLTLDVEVWDDSLMRMMTGIGNDVSNRVWEAEYRQDSPPRPTLGCDMKIREAFILAKYRDKAFLAPTRKKPNEAMLDLFADKEKSPSMQEVIHCFAAGAEWEHKDANGQTVLHLLAQNNQNVVAAEFCCRNGAPVNAKDKAGSTALVIATRSRCTKISQCLVHHGATSSWSGATSSARRSSELTPTPMSPDNGHRRRGWTATTPRAQVLAENARMSLNSPQLKRESPLKLSSSSTAPTGAQSSSSGGSSSVSSPRSKSEKGSGSLRAPIPLKSPTSPRINDSKRISSPRSGRLSSPRHETNSPRSPKSTSPTASPREQQPRKSLPRLPETPPSSRKKDLPRTPPAGRRRPLPVPGQDGQGKLEDDYVDVDYEDIEVPGDF